DRPQDGLGLGLELRGHAVGVRGAVPRSGVAERVGLGHLDVVPRWPPVDGTDEQHGAHPDDEDEREHAEGDPDDEAGASRRGRRRLPAAGA
ncbi:hypothetical protein DF186_16405, partial [Enterococcus hirae]